MVIIALLFLCHKIYLFLKWLVAGTSKISIIKNWMNTSLPFCFKLHMNIVNILILFFRLLNLI